MPNLKPCPFRRADDEGHILCEKIKTGDREITPSVCHACPVIQINCAHLRATLDHSTRPPIVVRWSNGKTRVWDDFASEIISLERAACAAKVMPIREPRDCVACALRAALIAPDGAMIAPPGTALPAKPARAPRAPRTTPASAPSAPAIAPPVVSALPAPTALAAPTPPAAETRSKIVAAEIIQLQEWLAKKTPPEKSVEPPAAPEVAPPPRVAQAARVLGEERRVGWTD